VVFGIFDVCVNIYAVRIDALLAAALDNIAGLGFWQVFE
jgi:hypothetical protein